MNCIQAGVKDSCLFIFVRRTCSTASSRSCSVCSFSRSRASMRSCSESDFLWAATEMKSHSQTNFLQHWKGYVISKDTSSYLWAALPSSFSSSRQTRCGPGAFQYRSSSAWSHLAWSSDERRSHLFRVEKTLETVTDESLLPLKPGDKNRRENKEVTTLVIVVRNTLSMYQYMLSVETTISKSNF